MYNASTKRHEYSIAGWVMDSGKLSLRRITSEAIRAEFERCGSPLPESFRRLIDSGMNYWNEDFDVLSATIREIEIGRAHV